MQSKQHCRTSIYSDHRAWNRYWQQSRIYEPTSSTQRHTTRRTDESIQSSSAAQVHSIGRTDAIWTQRQHWAQPLPPRRTTRDLDPATYNSLPVSAVSQQSSHVRSSTPPGQPQLYSQEAQPSGTPYRIHGLHCQR